MYNNLFWEQLYKSLGAKQIPTIMAFFFVLPNIFPSMDKIRVKKRANSAGRFCENTELKVSRFGWGFSRKDTMIFSHGDPIKDSESPKKGSKFHQFRKLQQGNKQNPQKIWVSAFVTGRNVSFLNGSPSSSGRILPGRLKRSTRHGKPIQIKRR